MLKKLAIFLRQPYPFGGDFAQKILQNVAVGVFVALFLIVFQPFGTAQWEAPYKNLFLAGFGVVSFLGPTLVHGLLFAWLGKFKLEKNWNIWREIGQYIVVLILIALGNMLYSNLVGISSMSLAALMAWLLIVAMVAIFPITAGVLLRHGRYLALSQKEAAVMEDQLQHAQRAPALLSPSRIESLIFYAENEKDTLVVEASALLFIESADNYSSFVWLKNGQVQKQLLRGSMKRFEDQIGRHPAILRCHRSYIVNLRHVEHVSGNAQGYRLALRHFNMEVPVARQYGPAVLAGFKALSA